jgi:hypothetical protein
VCLSGEELMEIVEEDLGRRKFGDGERSRRETLSEESGESETEKEEDKNESLSTLGSKALKWKIKQGKKKVTFRKD